MFWRLRGTVRYRVFCIYVSSAQLLSASLIKVSLHIIWSEQIFLLCFWGNFHQEILKNEVVSVFLYVCSWVHSLLIRPDCIRVEPSARIRFSRERDTREVLPTLTTTSVDRLGCLVTALLYLKIFPNKRFPPQAIHHQAAVTKLLYSQPHSTISTTIWSEIFCSRVFPIHVLSELGIGRKLVTYRSYGNYFSTITVSSEAIVSQWHRYFLL